MSALLLLLLEHVSLLLHGEGIGSPSWKILFQELSHGEGIVGYTCIHISHLMEVMLMHIFDHMLLPISDHLHMLLMVVMSLLMLHRFSVTISWLP